MVSKKDEVSHPTHFCPGNNYLYCVAWVSFLLWVCSLSDMNVLLMDMSATYICSLTICNTKFFTSLYLLWSRIGLARDGPSRIWTEQKKNYNWPVLWKLLWDRVIRWGDNRKHENLVGGRLMALAIKYIKHDLCIYSAMWRTSTLFLIVNVLKFKSQIPIVQLDW